MNLEEWKKTQDLSGRIDRLLFYCWHTAYRVGAEDVTPIVAGSTRLNIANEFSYAVMSLTLKRDGPHDNLTDAYDEGYRECRDDVLDAIHKVTVENS